VISNNKDALFLGMVGLNGLEYTFVVKCLFSIFKIHSI
jgi:hypothetical protein